MLYCSLTGNIVCTQPGSSVAGAAERYFVSESGCTLHKIKKLMGLFVVYEQLFKQQKAILLIDCVY